ncbi:hypothetical protein GGR93_000061 [Sulfitobacter noctilucicola]|uniref:DUF1674 domain-containing protein n=1 Tax=Sulfitobacter noctilucicola TaxID=1342301 RepID=A0A7W6Q443_9RHOB|nr:DUF1674 domain-containing protein [Sulfitobacter noctilucicola]MBB4172300.1 hypothetical protein [Sulfitobacter noctilucicola]
MTDKFVEMDASGDPAPRPIPDTPGQPTPVPAPDLPGQPAPNPKPAPKPIPPAAQRALAEAEERRKKAAEIDMPPELGGRDGPEPVRYGDWEKKGLAVDF